MGFLRANTPFTNALFMHQGMRIIKKCETHKTTARIKLNHEAQKGTLSTQELEENR